METKKYTLTKKINGDYFIFTINITNNQTIKNDYNEILKNLKRNRDLSYVNKEIERYEKAIIYIRNKISKLLHKN